MLFVGLHITKCAGTTLAYHVRNSLPPQRWYLCSGFRDVQELGMLQLPERVNFDGLSFIFGHFVHESMFSIAGERPVFLFTGIRAPVERAISEFYHMCKIRRNSSRPPLSADEFLAQRKNTMCVEMIRAFPSIADSVEGSLSDKALAICKMFDLVYETENFEASVRPLLDLMRLENPMGESVNTRGEVASDPELQKVEAEIRERIHEHFDQDEVLFEALRPQIGKLYPFRQDGQVAASPERTHWELRLRERTEGMEQLSDHFARYFVADYRNLDRLDELDRLIASKLNWLDQLRAHRARIRNG